VLFSDPRPSLRAMGSNRPQIETPLEGPGARALKNAPNNLTLAAGMALRDACARTGLGAKLTLHKELPIAAGVGGGSAEAAAALQVLTQMWGNEFGEAAQENLGAQLGSDVPACVRGRPLLMRGTGERLQDIATPDLPTVLVNPGVALETRRVFERYDELGAHRDFREVFPPPAHNFRSFVAELASGYHNDLQAAAAGLCAEIGRTLDAIRSQPGCLLARMSGSGPTCFGIFETEAAAEHAAEAISDRKRRYWVRATVLRGAAPMPLD
jgi:4-diphosphocytidyl-2-C-methyl-D-erythritol kinase